MTPTIPTADALERPDLHAALADLLRCVPPGRVTTYGDLAEALGSVSAAKWVAEAVSHPSDDVRHLVHRVVRRTGEPGGYRTGRVADKLDALRREGVAFRDGRVDLERHRFADFPSDGEPPLARLARRQTEIAAAAEFPPYRGSPKFVGGLDVAYPRSGEAAGAFVVVERATGRLEWSTRTRQPVTFPYIPGFLAYRELPVHFALLREAAAANRLPPVVFVDGNGLLHPRRAGVTIQLGVLTGLRTIGVGKKLLCGSVDLKAVVPEHPQPVVHEGEPIGTALRASEDGKPFFVSPGHRIDVRGATRLARACLHGHRLPEPIGLADRLSRARRS